jgi:long-chain acyl-CoA synthetase
MKFKKKWNGKYEQPDNLVASFENAVQSFSGNKFIGTKNSSGIYEWVTYQQVGERVDALRAGLASLGVKRNDPVGIISFNSVEWVVCAFATYGLGAFFVPMYEKELFSIWEYMIRDSGIKVLFVPTEELYGKLKDLPKKIKTLKHVILIKGEGKNTMGELEKKGRMKPVPATYPSSSDTAVLIYTSGTTGDPKGTLLSHGNCTSCSKAGWHLFTELQSHSLSFSHLPWAHSYGFSAELNNWIQFGGAIAVMDTLETLAEDMAKVAPTYLISVPRVFNRIYAKIMVTVKEEGGIKLRLFNMALQAALERHRTGRKSLKYILLDKTVLKKIRAKFGGRLEGALTASAKMNPEIAEFFFAIGIPVYDCYGMTETSPAVTMSHSTQYRPGSVGRALEYIDVVIDRSKVDDGSDDGEIIIYGPNVMKGYHKKPKQTAEVMTKDGGIRSGDRGRIDEDGYLYITGRFKEEYKLNNGKFIFPADIEEEIKLLPYITNVMVYGDGRPYNVLLIVPDIPVMQKLAKEVKLSVDLSDLLKSNTVKKLITAEIANHLMKKFRPYEIPVKIAFLEEDFTVENGLLTQTMKVRRPQVIERYRKVIDELYKEKNLK